MKNYIFINSIFAAILLLTSCSKDNPVPEVDQEEISGASIRLIEVEAEEHGDHYHYHDLIGGDTTIITFSGENFLPPVDAHVHLEVGKSYKFELTVKDFAGRESQQSFIEREDQHFAFLLGIPNESIIAEYADRKLDSTKVKVGINGYLRVQKATESFTFRYLMRHLNPGVKKDINPSTDIFNEDFMKFGGANDIDLKFQMHLVDGAHHED